MMQELVLNEQQSDILASATEPVTIRDARGVTVATIPPPANRIHLDAAELEKINRRMTENPATFPTFREAIERLEARAN
jgi:hypothetical protein